VPSKKQSTAGKNFSKVPPKKYKGKDDKSSGDASKSNYNQILANRLKSQPNAATGMGDNFTENQVVYKIKYINNTG
jgi:hypothetical protein